MVSCVVSTTGTIQNANMYVYAYAYVYTHVCTYVRIYIWGDA